MSMAEHIANSALTLLYAQGIHATGVDALAQHAGVTKKTLYRHYPSKELLIEATLALRHTMFMRRMQLFVQERHVPDRPLAYIDFIAQWVQESDFCGCYFINASAEYSDLQAPVHQQANAHKQAVLHDLVAYCASAGATRAVAAAQALFLLGEGLIVSTQVMGTQPELIQMAQSMARLQWQQHCS